MSEHTSPNPTLLATLPRRKARNAVAYTLALAMPLLALCYFAGETTYTNPQQRSADLYDYDQLLTHGFPFVGLTERSHVSFSVSQQKITQSAATNYDWNVGTVLLDALLWLAVAAFAYWIISDLFARVRNLRAPSPEMRNTPKRAQDKEQS